jgi:hypothetical protein
LHGLRAVHSGVPGRLHFAGGGQRRQDRLGCLDARAGALARTRYAARKSRLEREQREHEERLEAKARMKLADLASHSVHTDPATLDRKRAVIEAALATADHAGAKPAIDRGAPAPQAVASTADL